MGRSGGSPGGAMAASLHAGETRGFGMPLDVAALSTALMPRHRPVPAPAESYF